MDLSSIYAGLKLVTGPTQEPLGLDQAQKFLRVSSDQGGPIDQDIAAFITLARQLCETATRRAFLQQTWQLSLKNWPGRDYQNWPASVQSSGLDTYTKFNYVPLPHAAPLQSVTSVTYLDTTNTPFTMPQGNVSGGYNVDANFEPGRIVLPFSQIWPTAILLPGAPIQIVYVCGYPDPDTFQSSFEGYAAVIQAMKMLIAYCFENKIPPSEMRRASVDAGMEYVIEQNLSMYRVH